MADPSDNPLKRLASEMHRWLVQASAAEVAVGLLFAGCGGGDTTGPNPDPDPEPQNRTPTANAAADQNVSATLPVQLDGSGSTDPDGDPLTYSWSLASVPDGSTASFEAPTAAETSFVPDLAGIYVAQLLVSDQTDSSAPDQVTVTAVDNSIAALIGPAGGEIQSKDGDLTLLIPAGALATDTEIRVTLISPDQWPIGLEPLGSLFRAYDLKPDGLQFNVLVPLELALPTGATGEEGELQAPGSILVTLSDSGVEYVDDHVIIADGAQDRVSSSASLSHFTIVAEVRPGRLEEPFLLVTASGVPDRIGANVPFSVEVAATSVGDLPMITAVGPQGDFSDVPVQKPLDFDGSFTKGLNDLSNDEWTSVNIYHCFRAGLGRYYALLEVVVQVPASRNGIFIQGEYEPYTQRYVLEKPVECVEPPTPPEAPMNPIGHLRREAGGDWFLRIIDQVTFDPLSVIPWPQGTDLTP